MCAVRHGSDAVVCVVPIAPGCAPGQPAAAEPAHSEEDEEIRALEIELWNLLTLKVKTLRDDNRGSAEEPKGIIEIMEEHKPFIEPAEFVRGVLGEADADDESNPLGLSIAMAKRATRAAAKGLKSVAAVAATTKRRQAQHQLLE